jgi:diguanylate cyclase (GGDEF)-like protein
MFDIENFKPINGHYEYAIGDEVLKAFVEQYTKYLRRRDLIGRLGGDKFAIILFDVDQKNTIKIAERMTNLETLVTATPGQTLEFTASIGVATQAAEDTSLDDLLNRVDKALLVSKRTGRNRAIEINDK